jgi:hypothetical protein
MTKRNSTISRVTFSPEAETGTATPTMERPKGFPKKDWDGLKDDAKTAIAAVWGDLSQDDRDDFLTDIDGNVAEMLDDTADAGTEGNGPITKPSAPMTAQRMFGTKAGNMFADDTELSAIIHDYLEAKEKVAFAPLPVWERICARVDEETRAGWPYPGSTEESVAGTNRRPDRYKTTDQNGNIIRGSFMADMADTLPEVQRIKIELAKVKEAMEKGSNYKSMSTHELTAEKQMLEARVTAARGVLAKALKFDWSFRELSQVKDIQIVLRKDPKTGKPARTDRPVILHKVAGRNENPQAKVYTLGAFSLLSFDRAKEIAESLADKREGKTDILWEDVLASSATAGTDDDGTSTNEVTPIDPTRFPLVVAELAAFVERKEYMAAIRSKLLKRDEESDLLLLSINEIASEFDALRSLHMTRLENLHAKQAKAVA